MSRVTVKPEILRWARERADRSVESLRGRFPKYEQWERGAAAPTLKQLEVFAEDTSSGFAIPYFDNGQHHDDMPDFIIRLKGPSARYLILETKGYNPLEEVKGQAADRWVNAVNADGRSGQWEYKIAHKPEDVPAHLDCLGQAPRAAEP